METLGLSPSTPKPRSRWLELFWPVIDSDVSARTAAQNAMYACFVIGALNLFGLFNPVTRLASLVLFSFFVIAGFGIRAFSPVAVWTTLVLYAMDTIALLLVSPAFLSFVRIIALGLFIGGVRAVYFAQAWQKDHPEEDVRQESLEGLGPAGRALALAPLRLWPWTRPIFVLYLAAFGLILLLVITVLPFVRPVVLTGGSMAPTLAPGDRMLVLNAWVMGPVERGDVVSLRSPAESAILFKRVIGLPGDRIHLHDKQVVLDGHPLEEPYVQHITTYIDAYRDNFPSGAFALSYGNAETMLRDHVQNGEVVVPPGQYFVLGDNRDNSLDSRYFGFVEQNRIVGRPVYVYASRRGAHGIPRVHIAN